MSQARQNFRRGVENSSTIYNLLNPPKGIRDEMQRKGVEPKNHMIENKKRIEEIKRKKFEEEEDKQRRSERKPFKLKEYEGVESRVIQATNSVIEANSSRHQFLKKQDRELPESSKPFIRDEAQRKPPLPQPIEIEPISTPHKNYLRDNKMAALTMKPKEHAIKPLVPPVDPSHKVGEVPEYLKRMKLEKMFEEQYILDHLPDPDCPPGMVLLPEDERINTLASLTATLENLKIEQQRLPLVIETPSQKRRAQDVENRITETEKAIKIFSRQKVFVMPD